MSVAQSIVTTANDFPCSRNEVARLVWTMIALATVAAVTTIVRPRWNALAGLVAADLLWVWVDLGGPIVVSQGSHGIHLADVPVLVTVPALVIAAARLWLRRRTRVS